MIKYLGSKRRLVPALGAIAEATGASTALDLFTGTTRVAQEFKRRGIDVLATDLARYSEILAQCYVVTDLTKIDKDGLLAVVDELNGLPGRPGYFTEVFCEESRFFQPKNGARVDAIRDHLEAEYRTSSLYPVLLTSLMEAADRVDSTTGVQMAYLKQWAPRAHNDLELRVPELIAGGGRAIRGDATVLVDEVPHVDFAYLDPPYNQHRYFTNYHIWETLVAWDAPEHYGIACKRIDCRDDTTKSVFNAKRQMRDAFASTVERVRSDFLAISFNNEGWVELADLIEMCRPKHETVDVLAFDSKRYVGAQIGIYNPSGDKVGEVSHLRNKEFVVVAGPKEKVEAAVAAAAPPVAPASLF